MIEIQTTEYYKICEREHQSEIFLFTLGRTEQIDDNNFWFNTKINNEEESYANSKGINYHKSLLKNRF